MSRASTMLRRWGVVAMVLAGLVPGDARGQLVLRTREILQLEQMQGQPQWIQSTQQRLAGAVWRFNPDGTFSFTAPDLRNDLYPLTGWYSRSGSLLQFTADRRVVIGQTGTAHASIRGSVSLGQPSVIQMTWSSGMANSARINNIPFNNSAYSSYRIAIRADRM